jgi:hypothetical protein
VSCPKPRDAPVIRNTFAVAVRDMVHYLHECVEEPGRRSSSERTSKAMCW